MQEGETESHTSPRNPCIIALYPHQRRLRVCPFRSSAICSTPTTGTSVPLAALDMAIEVLQPATGHFHHSDRGLQYASAIYVARLTDIGAQISMSAKGTPYDNANAESFFKTLKHEEVALNQYEPVADAENQIGRFIDDMYNQKRLHSSLGYLPPAEYHSLYNANQQHPSDLVQ